MKTTKEKFIRALTLADVTRAYEGKPGCCCGCRGKYFAPVKHPRHKRANPRACERILRAIQAGFYCLTTDTTCDGVCELTSGYVSYETKNKLYIVYFFS